MSHQRTWLSSWITRLSAWLSTRWPDVAAVIIAAIVVTIWAPIVAAWWRR